jgi:hypothetical protein
MHAIEGGARSEAQVEQVAYSGLKSVRDNAKSHAWPACEVRIIASKDKFIIDSSSGSNIF